MEHLLALVAVENVAYHFDILYGYLIPEELKHTVRKGCAVLVPFGRSKNARRQAIVFDIAICDEINGYKSILSLVDTEPVAKEEMLEIAVFLKERTFCTYYEGVRTQIPGGYSFKTEIKYLAKVWDNDIKLTEAEQQLYDFMLSLDRAESERYIYSSLGYNSDCELIKKLEQKGLLIRSYSAERKIGEATAKTVSLSDNYSDDEGFRLTSKQKEVIDVLEKVGSCSLKELCYFTGYTAAVVKALEKKGLIKISDAVYYRTPEISLTDKNAKKPICLTASQQEAFEGLRGKLGTAGTALLYGVTGSGKTSVFLSLIDKVISEDKQVIVMVPEISLTPQLMAIFKGRYGNNVAIFHSALSEGERRDEYKRVKDGLVKIAVGTRSAVFAPFGNLGLIVIDEEQEHTYKSEGSPRYHTVDVAKFRAAKHNALLLLSSATPCVTSYCLADMGKYSLFKLNERYGTAVLPEVETVDMKRERSAGNKYNISSLLLERLENNLKDKKQSILLINRRGYNTFAACNSCGSVIDCPHCSISMTYHSANNRLMCHYCGYSVPFTRVCKECGKDTVRYAGYGTQRIEEEIAELLPEARVLRMDTDSTSSRHAFEKGLIDFAEGKYDIMLGTQMVAKGLNFENVTLVGVINADQQLHNDDFKSQERTFALLTQVVGRSGRGAFKGTAVIQSLEPDNNIIKLAQNQDYEGFFKNEIIIRRAMIYPPFCDICSITFACEKELKALECSKAFLQSLRQEIELESKKEKVIVLGPIPPRISKINNKYRYRLIIKCKNTRGFRNIISRLLIEYGKNKLFNEVTISPDFNPENLA